MLLYKRNPPTNAGDIEFLSFHGGSDIEKRFGSGKPLEGLVELGQQVGSDLVSNGVEDLGSVAGLAHGLAQKNEGLLELDQQEPFLLGAIHGAAAQLKERQGVIAPTA